ncbi:MAG: GNAT family N-acetyltransferase [Bacteroidota bacterium]
MSAKDWKLSHLGNLNTVPEPLEKDFCIYNSRRLLELKYSEIEAFTFELKNSKLYGKIHFVKENRKLISLPKLPFGSFEWNRDISESNISECIRILIREVSKWEIDEVIVNHKVPIYSPEAEKVESSLISNGFEVIGDSINHHLQINREPLSDNIHKSEKRRLRIADKSDLIFREEPGSKLEEVYRFVLKCRKNRNHNVSISLEELKTYFQIYPEFYKIFSVSNGEEPYAVCIGVMVKKDVFYYFLPASNPEYNSLSPMVYLLISLYKTGQEQGWDYIDLGTSMLGEKTNEGLASFKKRMCGIETRKKTFQLKLDE